MGLFFKHGWLNNLYTTVKYIFCQILSFHTILHFQLIPGKPTCDAGWIRKCHKVLLEYLILSFQGRAILEGLYIPGKQSESHKSCYPT